MQPNFSKVLPRSATKWIKKRISQIKKTLKIQQNWKWFNVQIMICMRPKNLFLRQIIFWPFHSFLIRKNLVEIFMVPYLVIRTDFGWEYEVPVCLQRLKINVSKFKSHFERCNERNIDIFIFLVWLSFFLIWLKKFPKNIPILSLSFYAASDAQIWSSNQAPSLNQRKSKSSSFTMPLHEWGSYKIERLSSHWHRCIKNGSLWSSTEY